MKVLATPYRNKGHLVVLGLLLLLFIICLSIILTIQTGIRCSIFESAFLWALPFDFVLVQPTVVGLTYVYRYLVSDEEDTIWSELHPYDGAEREM